MSETLNLLHEIVEQADRKFSSWRYIYGKDTSAPLAVQIGWPLIERARAICVSNEHPKGEDAQAAECAACQCGPKGETPVLPPPVSAGELGEPAEWAAKLQELYGWTGSAFLAGEKVEDEGQHKSDLYSFLCGLIGFLMAGEDAAQALQSLQQERQTLEENGIASCSAAVAEIVLLRADNIALRRKLKEAEAKLANLTKAIEQTETPESRAGCGMVRYDEHMRALTECERHLAAEKARAESAHSTVEQTAKALEYIASAKVLTGVVMMAAQEKARSALALLSKGSEQSTGQGKGEEG